MTITCNATSQSGQFFDIPIWCTNIKSYEWALKEYIQQSSNDFNDFEILCSFTERLVESQEKLDSDINEIVNRNFFSLITKTT